MNRSTNQRRLAATAAPETADLEIVVPGAGVEIRSTERNWAQLHPRIISKVADDLLLSDVTEYIRVRAVCKPWRGATTDPSLPQPRFFPRNWAMNPDDFEDDSEEHHFVNALTGASLRVRLPTPHEFSHHGATEGLLVLLHTLTDTVCFLNPLTLAFTDLPSFSSLPGDTSFGCDDITAAGIIVDQASRQPTAVLCVTAGQESAMFCAKLGEPLPHWEAVDVSCVEDDNEDEDDGEAELPAFKGGLAVRDRFYVPTRAGDVLTVELRPRPRLAYVARQDTSHRSCCSSCFSAFCYRTFSPGSHNYLVPSIDDEDDGMLLVRTTTGGDDDDDDDVCFGLFDVDLANRRVDDTLADIGDRAVFLPCVTLRSNVFPSLDEGVYAEGMLADWFGRNY